MICVWLTSHPTRRENPTQMTRITLSFVSSHTDKLPNTPGGLQCVSGSSCSWEGRKQLWMKKTAALLWIIPTVFNLPVLYSQRVRLPLSPLDWTLLRLLFSSTPSFSGQNRKHRCILLILFFTWLLTGAKWADPSGERLQSSTLVTRWRSQPLLQFLVF